MKSALEGIRVLDFTRYQQGPFATLLLCDMGAEGIMLPMVASAAEAKRIVESVKYHPDGQRGVALQLRSRTAQNPELRGTKHLVAMEKQCLVARGRNDDRTVILVPEIDQNRTVGITLLHVRFADRLPAIAVHEDDQPAAIVHAEVVGQAAAQVL